MALLDNMSMRWMQVTLTMIILVLFGISVAMTLTTPDIQIGDYDVTSSIDSGDMAWMLTCSALVLIMTPGIAFFYGGLIHSGGMVATIATTVLPLAIIPIIWTFVGFSVAFGDSVGGIFGNPATYGLMHNVGAAPWPAADTITTATWFIFQGMFAIVTPAVIVGAIPDRINFPALCLFLPIWHLIVYCPATHMVWTPNGIIAQWGLLDFAGGMVVHMSAGCSAFACALFIGPSKVRTEQPANIPFIVLGTTLLWFGWFGFNAGSAFAASVYASHAFLNTNIAAVMSMLVWMLQDQMMGHSYKVTGMCLGAIVGLVIITPAAGYVNVGAACIFGILGSIFCYWLLHCMIKYLRHIIDDTLDAFACHGMGGVLGTLLTACFQNPNAGASIPGAFYGNPIELGKSIAVVCALTAWYTLATYAICWFVNLFLSFRVNEEDELMGLDLSKHSEAPVTMTPRAKILPGKKNGIGSNPGSSTNMVPSLEADPEEAPGMIMAHGAPHTA